MATTVTRNTNTPSGINLTQLITTREPYVRPFDDAGIIFSGVVIFSFLFVGIMLNVLTMLVIYRYPRLRNVFMFFIFSLCVSDLISAIISPLFWYRRTLGFDHWALPNFLCKFYWAADIATSFSTAMHITSFATLRLISIRFPFLFNKITNNITLAWILTIWVISTGAGFVPFWLFFAAGKRDRYSDLPDARWPACTLNMAWFDSYELFQKIGFPMFLYIPVVLVVFVSVVIVYIVYRRSEADIVVSINADALAKRKQKDRQAVLQLTLIVCCFLVGYVPFTAYEFWSLQDQPNTPHFKRVDWWFGMLEYLFLRLSECLNPIFYNLGSTKMRKSTKRYLTKDMKICGKVARYGGSSTGTSSTSGV